MKSHVFSILAVTGLVLFAFQNCAEAPSNNDANSAQEVVVASTKDVSKVTYDPQLEYSATSVTKPLLSLDVPAGQMNVRDGAGNLKSCAVDADRIAAIDAILVNGKVCEPGPLPPDTAVCMAIGLADVKLEGSNVSVYLRPEICNNGAFLCAGQDAAFRTALSDLVANPPAACK